MKKSTAILITVAAFFMGVCVGFMTSPIKKGIHIHAGNGNTIYNNPKPPKISSL